MSIHKLHIFSKNREAVAAQKGYAYQQLKTLMDWIESRISNSDKEIYCEYEDDIFSRSVKEDKVKFTQIKLYSTDFSFSSESIETSIAHFFMLYVKGEYAFDKIEFSFETNASIVKTTTKGNDADLLKEWYENQGKVSQELLDRIRVRIKKILSDYINTATEDLSKKVEQKSEAQKAKMVFDGLKDEDLNAFILCIKWRFEGLDPSVAVQQLISDIENLIYKIPLPLMDEQAKVYCAMLINEVWERSIQDNPEKRKLTNDLLDSILLGAGDKEDKWYVGVLELARQTSKVQLFLPGEFQLVINGTRYCRWNLTDDSHKPLWLGLLKQYILLPDAPVVSKRKAIYEYIFLKLGNNPLKEEHESPISGDTDIIAFYIGEWQQRADLRDLEDDIVFLQLLKGQILRFPLPALKEKALSWEQEIEKYLDDEIRKESIVDRLCELLELRGHLEKQKDVLEAEKKVEGAFEYYKKIPPLLSRASYYSLARLYSQMDSMLKMLIHYDIREDLRENIEEFMKEISEYAQKTGLRHKIAHELVERGSLYLKNLGVSNYLKALDFFHQAKDQWRIEYTKEGYVLALINIAQVYNSLGMGYASKQYALLALWSTWHFSDANLHKRLPQALGLICHTDFYHGAWLNGVDNFNIYLAAKIEFDEKGLQLGHDEIYQKTIVEISAIVHAVPFIHPELTALIEDMKKKWGFVWKKDIEPTVKHIHEQIKDENELKKVLTRNCRDMPLNDCGPQRNIRFNALNIDWHIQFENSEAVGPIGEEFTSFLQVTLCEIARINDQLLEANRNVTIEIRNGHFQKEHLGEDKWIITVPEFNSNVEEEIQKHSVYLGSLVTSVLQHVSTLSKEEFNKFYIEKLLAKENLGSKVLEGTTYQRASRNLINQSLFESKKKSSFSPLPESIMSVTYRKYLIKNPKS